MPLEEVVAMLRARPFEPFAIHLDDGTRYEVRHPDQVLTTARALLVGVGAHQQEGYFDRADRVALVHVTRLEPLPIPSTGNGQQG